MNGDLAQAAIRIVTGAIGHPTGEPRIHCCEGQLYYAQTNLADDVIEVTIWPAAFDHEGEAARIVLAKPTAVNTPDSNGRVDPVVNVPHGDGKDSTR